VEHGAHDPLEEDDRDSTKPVEKPSLGERLLGVRTLDEKETPYSSTSAGSLIERLTASDQRLASHDERPAAPKRSLGSLRKKKGLAARLRIEIPPALRAREPRPWEDGAPALREPVESKPAVPQNRLHTADEKVERFPRALEDDKPPADKMTSVPESDTEVIDELAAEVDTGPIALESQTQPETTGAPEPVLAKSVTETPVSEAEPQPSHALSAPETEPRPAPTPTAAEPSAKESAMAAAALPQTPLGGGRGPLEHSMDAAARFVQLRYNALVMSLLGVSGLAALAAVALILAVVADAEWQIVAIVGGLEAVAMVALVALVLLLQHEPALRAAPTSTEMAQLETARTYLDKSFEFWEKYLTEREDGRPLTAEDVATAVSSLTAASHNLLDLETGLAKLSAKPTETTTRAPQSNGPTSPTRAAPVRSRPSRY